MGRAVKMRAVPGDQWLRWGPGARRLARADLRHQLDVFVAGEGLSIVGEVEGATEYDEEGRRVLLSVSGRVE